VAKAVRETVRSYDAVSEISAQYGDAGNASLEGDGAAIRLEEVPVLISALEKDMKEYAKAMEFERAAEVRDQIMALRELIGISSDRKITRTGKRKMRSRSS
jgi:excinuclease ABC subunit B